MDSNHRSPVRDSIFRDPPFEGFAPDSSLENSNLWSRRGERPLRNRVASIPGHLDRSGGNDSGEGLTVRIRLPPALESATNRVLATCLGDPEKRGAQGPGPRAGVIAGARTSRRNARDHRPLIE